MSLYTIQFHANYAIGEVVDIIPLGCRGSVMAYVTTGIEYDPSLYIVGYANYQGVLVRQQFQESELGRRAKE